MKVYLMVSAILVAGLFSLIWLYVLLFSATEIVPSTPVVQELSITETSSAMIPESFRSR